MKRLTSLTNWQSTESTSSLVYLKFSLRSLQVSQLPSLFSMTVVLGAKVIVFMVSLKIPRLLRTKKQSEYEAIELIKHERWMMLICMKHLIK